MWGMDVKDTMSFLYLENFYREHEYACECVGKGSFWLVLPSRISSCESKLPALPAGTWLDGEGNTKCIFSGDTDLKSRSGSMRSGWPSKSVPWTLPQALRPAHCKRKKRLKSSKWLMKSSGSAGRAV